jgi:excisionase family DNA binding protein
MPGSVRRTIPTMPSSIGRRDSGDEVAVVPTAARRADGRSVTPEVPSTSPALTPMEVGHPFGRRTNAPTLSDATRICRHGRRARVTNRCRRVASRANQRQSVPTPRGRRTTPDSRSAQACCADPVRRPLLRGRWYADREMFTSSRALPGAHDTRRATRSPTPALGTTRWTSGVWLFAISLGPRQIFCRVCDRWRAIRLYRTHETEVVVEETGRVLVFSVPEAARLLGISRTHAYGLVARGELVHVRLGRRIVVPRHALDALLRTPPDGPASA